MINSIDRRTFEATLRLQMPVTTEFLGIRHNMHSAPTAGLRVGPVDIELSLAEVDAFTAAALAMQTAAHQARERAEIACEPKTAPAPAAEAGS